MKNKGIKFQKSELQYEAHYKGKCIARLVLTDEDEETGISLVQNISVNKEHRRKGIAAALIKRAMRDHKIAFDNRPRYEHNEDSEGVYLSEDGMRLMMGLLKQGIIKRKNVLDPERIGNIKVEKKKKERERGELEPGTILSYLFSKKSVNSDDDTFDNQNNKKFTLSLK